MGVANETANGERQSSMRSLEGRGPESSDIREYWPA